MLLTNADILNAGSSLDVYARGPMWEYGLDFGHGTGHGIGMFLNVHEGLSLE